MLSYIFFSNVRGGVILTVQSFDEIINRIGTSSVKWDETEQIYGTKDVLPMWVADMDFHTPKAVLEAIEKRVQHGIIGYTSIPQSTRIAILNWVHTRQTWNINEEWITFSNGVVPAIAIAVQALTNKGDKIIVQSPVYNPFYEMIEKNERTIVHNPLILKD
jgi:cystathionine beta-lyase